MVKIENSVTASDLFFLSIKLLLFLLLLLFHSGRVRGKSPIAVFACFDIPVLVLIRLFSNTPTHN